MTGGGAKAFVHLGVYHVLRENGIKVDHIVSTSSGSLMAVLVAAGVSFDKIKKEFFSLRRRLSWFLPSLSEFGFISKKPLVKVISNLVKQKKIEDLPIPVTLVASNITKINDHIIKKGDIIKSVCATSAYPLLYKPVNYKGDLLIDGGILNSEPADIARKIGKGKIITVSLTSPFNREQGGLKNRMEIVYRSLFYYSEMSRRENADKYSDLIIYPLKHKWYCLNTWKGIFEFYNKKAMIEYYELGRKEALANLDMIKALKTE